MTGMAITGSYHYRAMYHILISVGNEMRLTNFKPPAYLDVCGGTRHTVTAAYRSSTKSWTALNIGAVPTAPKKSPTRPGSSEGTTNIWCWYNNSHSAPSCHLPFPFTETSAEYLQSCNIQWHRNCRDKDPIVSASMGTEQKEEARLACLGLVTITATYNASCRVWGAPDMLLFP